MLTRQENDLLTSVKDDAPMAQMIRECHWIPAIRAARLQASAGVIAKKQRWQEHFRAAS